MSIKKTTAVAMGFNPLRVIDEELVAPVCDLANTHTGHSDIAKVAFRHAGAQVQLGIGMK
jgi:hypothetical protein